ncbi:DUF350 domain-containing protein [Paenibacillus urinalis]|uniref:DUF350 domain-containing protein n=1 Tax=Paenibacillus urinalis TaxID=521520 RepID=A0ABY7X4K2_9BACL|nr:MULTISPECIES: DUF350 domain-containing protein [Paenibacillus]WDH97110.1 DUF350 domain-containing protein [Paenibacillus urinalis]WDI00773.1 DUF350 domain-containing protein [Paenibacillus urinalis]GAK39452.1 surface protein [Paenibacillus sp. TCA20]
MEFMDILRMLVWTGSGAVLLFILMYIDSLFTKYKDFAEVKAGNMAVTTRLIMKLFAQGYILSSSISVSYHLGDALIVSVISFIILLVIEAVVHFIIRRFAAFDIDGGMQQGKIGYGLFSGTLHVVGALIISASL